LAADTTPAAPTHTQAGGGLVVPIVDSTTNAIATITRVRVVDGVLTATGTITGQVTTTTGMVLNLANEPFSAPLTNLQSGGSCTILTLDVGAIHLDLLGLVLDTAPIHVTLTAQPGAGNLLGNLLCAVAHLLDNPNAPLTGISALLDRTLGAL
jgi:hypothetical protein